MTRTRKNFQTGSVLILVLWSLTLLSIFAVHLNLRVRGKITFLSRLEKRRQLQELAEAGARKAMSVVRTDLKQNPEAESVQSKQLKYNNPLFFENKPLGSGSFEVSRWEYDDDVYRYRTVYGLADEERKVNINKADRETIERLILHVLNNEERARELSAAIYDWKEYGQSEVSGLGSDDFYSGLEYSYDKKSADYETLEELMLVKGMNQDVYRWLSDFVTIYGDGKVNVNTAPKTVLIAVGFTDELAQKLLYVRRGADGTDATGDDVIFQTTESLGLVLAQTAGLEAEEIAVIDDLNTRSKLTTFSRHYKIKSSGRLSNSDEKSAIVCVFDAVDGTIKQWREL